MDTGDPYNSAVKRLLDLKTYPLAPVWSAAVCMVNIVEEGSVHGHRDGPCAHARVCVCVCVCENIIPFTCTVTLGMGLSSLRIRKCTLRVV